MQRREFISLLGSAAAAWPLAARAQQPDRLQRIGALINTPEDHPETKPRVRAFREGLEKLGWSEGRNIRIDYRFASAPNLDQARVVAKELVALQPDVIFAVSGAVTAAFQHETRTIPIVFILANDPIGSGLVASLARPGGNITGFMQLQWDIAGKWLQMLKEIAPPVARAAFILNPKTTTFDLREAEALARSLAIDLVSSSVETAAEIERTIASFAQVPNSSLIVPPDVTTVVHRDLIIALAAQHRLPAVYAFRHFVAAGGLMSYGIDPIDFFRQAPSYIDRILRGAKPADLPVQAPTRYETVINLKTAKALGLTVPAGLLVAADEVID
jgi:putative ABC transport system substrate-binding protein